MKQLISTALIAFAELDLGKVLEDWNELYLTARGVILGIAIAITTIMAVVVGVQFGLARGDDEKIKKAKSATKGMIIGWAVTMVIIAFAPMIIEAFAKWAGVEITQ